MKKYSRLLKTDLKNIFKDKMILFMVISPVFLLAVFGWLVPFSLKLDPDFQGTSDYEFVMNLMIAIAFGLMAYMYAFMLGMLILEDKDSNTLQGISVTSTGLKGYLIYKSVLVFAFSFIGTLIFLYGLRILFEADYKTIASLPHQTIFLFSFSSSFFAPAAGLFIGLIAKNKVSGFMIGKSFGLVTMLPMIFLLGTFQGYLQYLFGIFPNTWAIKAIMNDTIVAGGVHILDNDANLPSTVYHIIGIIYGLILTAVLIKIFEKKAMQ